MPRPFGCLAHKDIKIIWLSNLLNLRETDEGYSRNASCALKFDICYREIMIINLTLLQMCVKRDTKTSKRHIMKLMERRHPQTKRKIDDRKIVSFVVNPCAKVTLKEGLYLNIYI